MLLHMGLPARCCCIGLAKIESARGFRDARDPIVHLQICRELQWSLQTLGSKCLGLVVRCHCSVIMLIIIVILSLNSSCES